MEIAVRFNELKEKLLKSGIDLRDATLDDIIYNFEDSLDKQYKKDHGIVYTPQWLADAMAWRVLNLKLKKETGYCWDDILGDKVEQYQPSVSNMLWSESLNFRICDPCTGAGVFVFSILKAYIKVYKILKNNNNVKQLTELDLVLQLLSNNIYCIELDASAVEVTKFRLWAYCVKLGYAKELDELKTNIFVGDSLNQSFEGLNTEYSHHLTEVDDYIRDEYIEEWEKNWSIYHSSVSEKEKIKAKIELVNLAIQISSDITGKAIPFKCDRRMIKNKNKFKAFSWKLEFNGVFEENLDNPGFDIIIGNPPYVRNIDNQSLKSETLGNTANLYMYFLELVNTRGATGCITSMIVPNNWFSAAYAKDFRKLYTSKIESIIDFNMHYVFKGVFIATAIITMYKEDLKTDTLKYSNVEHIMEDSQEDDLLHYSIERQLDIPRERLYIPRKYIFGESKLYELLDRLNKLPTLYEQYGARVEKGIVVDIQDRCNPDSDTTYLAKGEDVLTYGTLSSTKLATKQNIQFNYENYLIIPEVTRKIRCCKLGKIVPLDSTVYVENTHENLIALLNSEVFNLIYSIFISTNFMISYAEVRFPRKNKSLEETPVPFSLEKLDIFRKATKNWENVTNNDILAINEQVRELYGLSKGDLEILRKYNV